MRTEELKALLERAYEEGWRGCLEMKGEVAARLAGECRSGTADYAPISFTTTTGDYENMVGHHYYYSTTTMPSAEIVRRDEVV